MNNYRPIPLETSDVELPEELEQLTEMLAANAHDNWAILRLKEGWVYGEKRDDEAKTHPDLVPYEELTNSEQEYDRQTAMQTLRAIMALGYKIEKA